MNHRLTMLPSLAVLAIASIAVAAPPQRTDGSRLARVVVRASPPIATEERLPPPPALPAGPAAVAGPCSVGFPWDGTLPGGVALQPNALLRTSPHCLGGGRFFGTPELVGMLARSALTVASRLTVGELSPAGGGYALGHKSHTNGRDADVAFYLAATDGSPVEANGYLEVGADGATAHGVLFDDARNWALVRAWLTDPVARVQYVFVEEHLRARLLAEALREGASTDLQERAAHTLMQPPRGDPHRDHFHVRVFCDARDRPNCRDKGPYWPWYEGLAQENGAPPLRHLAVWAGRALVAGVCRGACGERRRERPRAADGHPLRAEHVARLHQHRHGRRELPRHATRRNV